MFSSIHGTMVGSNSVCEKHKNLYCSIIELLMLTILELEFVARYFFQNQYEHRRVCIIVTSHHFIFDPLYMPLSQNLMADLNTIDSCTVNICIHPLSYSIFLTVPHTYSSDMQLLSTTILFLSLSRSLSYSLSQRIFPTSASLFIIFCGNESRNCMHLYSTFLTKEYFTRIDNKLIN